MFRPTLLASAVALALGASASAEETVDEATVEKINAMLTEMQCEMDEDDIERDGDGYELDDVFCADGQYDIELDGDLKVVNKRKE